MFVRLVTLSAGEENPTYLKMGNSDYIVNGIGAVLILTGLIKIGSGLYHMSNGTNKLEVV